MIENEIIGQLRLDSPGLRAKEHTAQVPPAERQEREREFSDAALPVLYCSPTMELGVDINALSAVGLRNVPPTPANYSQRAGRAGRSGVDRVIVGASGSPGSLRALRCAEVVARAHDAVGPCAGCRVSAAQG